MKHLPGFVIHYKIIILLIDDTLDLRENLKDTRHSENTRKQIETKNKK